MFAQWPPARRIIVSTLICICVGVLVITLFDGFVAQSPLHFFQLAAVVIGAAGAVMVVVALLVTKLGGYRDPSDEDEFELLVRQSERLARENLAAEPEEEEFLIRDPYNPGDFEELVREALDDLPDLLIKALDHVAVIISDQGRRHHAYGLYQGDTVAHDRHHQRIVIFRDTLLRDFGHNPDELRDQVTRTVRHELAHHLGADELGVRELGL